MEFDAQTAPLPQETRQEWEEMVRKWEKDPSLQDPYINEHAGASIQVVVTSNDSSIFPCAAPSLADIEREIAAEEEVAVRTGQKLPMHDVGPGEFLSIGLDLEEQQ